MSFKRVCFSCEQTYINMWYPSGVGLGPGGEAGFGLGHFFSCCFGEVSNASAL